MARKPLAALQAHCIEIQTQVRLVLHKRTASSATEKPASPIIEC